MESHKNTSNLIIDFHDGGEHDVAILQRMESQFGDDDKDYEEDECKLRGHLRDEPTTPVTVIGCPGNNTFQVSQNY